MRYTVFQPILSDAQIDEVNRAGWGGVEWGPIYNDLTTVPRIGSDVQTSTRVRRGFEAGLYQKSYTVETDSLEGVFAATNGMGPGVKERFGRPKSGSVGDVVIGSDGSAWACASFGWHELTDDVAALFEESEAA